MFIVMFFVLWFVLFSIYKAWSGYEIHLTKRVHQEPERETIRLHLAREYMFPIAKAPEKLTPKPKLQIVVAPQKLLPRKVSN